MAPRCIRLTELADLLGVGRRAVKNACADAGFPIVQVRRSILGNPKVGHSPLYLPVESAVEVARRLLGRNCDIKLIKNLRYRAEKQNQAFGGAPVETRLAV